MNILRTLRGLWGTKQGSTQISSMFATATQWEKPPTRTTQELLKAYDTSPWLRAVVSKIGDGIGSTCWEIMRQTKAKSRGPAARQLLHVARRGGPLKRHAAVWKATQGGDMEQVEDHEVLRRLENPNPLFQGSNLWRLAAANLDLSGELWLMKEYTGSVGEKLQKRVPDALWPLIPTWIKRRPGPGRLTANVAPSGMTGLDLPLSAFVWAMSTGPADPYGRGSSVAQALATDLDLDEYAASYLRAFFFNNAIPPVLITGEKLVRDGTDEQRLEAKFREKSGGVFRRFVPYFLNKEVQVHQIGKTLEELGVTGIRKQERDIILQVYGMSPETMGIIENSNRSTIESAEYLFARFILIPRLELMRMLFQVQLLEPAEDDRNLILDYLSPVQEDKAFKLEVMKAAPHAFLVDEFRALGGEDPLPDEEGRVHVFGSPQVLVVPEGGLLEMAAPEEPLTGDQTGNVTPPEGEEEPEEDGDLPEEDDEEEAPA